MSKNTLRSLFVILAVVVGAPACSAGAPGPEESTSGGTPRKTPPSETPSSETPPSKTPPSETPPSQTPPSETPPSQTPPNLAGVYNGLYQGDAAGPVRMTITGNDIDVIARIGSTDYPGSGTVNSAGSVSVGVGTGNGVTVTFVGTFTSTGGSGTWQSSVATSGTWSVAK